ncbi:hypothetical protein DBT_1769 [Dissulfuribacter thermophilus]|uniref:Uncharacterized protein n=1 Tax=Dissulfuribacter thermophilus TaxID=1156395 RepID=A0A1B9F435_9BACT|nr:hypothetical protein DBT_1769 [Dissulfuribacter thermophilus]
MSFGEGRGAACGWWGEVRWDGQYNPCGTWSHFSDMLRSADLVGIPADKVGACVHAHPLNPCNKVLSVDF